jgi:ABC-type Fe3+ transport system substrate-binding protein
MPRIALADPERSETGLTIVLATLDRARQVDGDVERGWQWWAARAQQGLVLTGDDDAATREAGQRGVSHALSLSETANPLAGLAPIPHAVSVTASTRNLDAARALVDWLVGESAAGAVRISPWTVGAGPLAALVNSAPALDIEWARQSYTATRGRWSQSGFGAALPAS